MNISRFVIALILIATISPVCSKGGGGRGGGGFGGGGRGGFGGGRSSGGRSGARGVFGPTFVKRVSGVGSVESTARFRSFIITQSLLLHYHSDHNKHIINSPSSPMLYENKTYYWDSSFFTPSEELPTTCINKIDPNDPQLGRIFFADNSRPQEIVYGCAEYEICCGYECCKENSFFTSLFTLLVMILIFSILGIFFIEGFRWALHCIYFCKHGRSRDFEPLSI